MDPALTALLADPHGVDIFPLTEGAPRVLAACFFRVLACPLLLRRGTLGVGHQIRVHNRGKGISGDFISLGPLVGIRRAVFWNLTHLHTVGPQVRPVQHTCPASPRPTSKKRPNGSTTDPESHSSEREARLLRDVERGLIQCAIRYPKALPGSLSSRWERGFAEVNNGTIKFQPLFAEMGAHRGSVREFSELSSHGLVDFPPKKPAELKRSWKITAIGTDKGDLEVATGEAGLTLLSRHTV